MRVQLRVLFAAGFMSESSRNDVASGYLFANAGAASDSRLRVAIFEDSQGGFDGCVMRLDDTLIFLNQCSDADALWSAEGVVRGGAMFRWIDRL